MIASSRRVLIVDDHPLCAMAMGAVISACDDALEIVTVGSLRELALFAGSDDVALILLDLRLPDACGLNGIQAVREVLPDVPLCIVSGQHDAVTVRQALAQGLVGYLPKSLAYDELVRSIRLLLAGESAFPRLTANADATSGPLSGAEERVMQLLCLGLQNKRIAFDLGISESTVKSHLAHIFDKLRVTNRSQAIIAYELGRDDHGAPHATGRELPC
jgi:DNA-binding NarL/FixJ family response regulator